MNWLTTFDPDWSRTLAFLADTALKGSLVIAIAALVAWMLRGQSAAARHSVWSAAIAAQLVIPVLSAVLPTWRVPVLAEPSWIAEETPAVAASPDESSEPASPVMTEQPLPNRVENAPIPAPSASPAPEPARWNVSPVKLLAVLWLLGCIAVLVRLAAGTAVVSRMAGKGERVTDEKWLGLLHRLAVTLNISRPLTLLRGDALGVPVTWGIVYPVVLLPDDADAWPEERRRYVLVHEMAHVKRLDAFTQLIAQFALAIFWFNPLVWVAAQQMRRERENACDDYVITHGTRPSEYAHDLLRLVQDIDTEGHRAAAPAFAALAMARRSEFEGRMLSILNPRIRRQGLTRKGVVMGLLGTFLVAAPLAAFSPFSTNQSFQAAVRPDSVGPASDTAAAPTTSPVPATSQTSMVGSQVTESSGFTANCDRVGNFEGTSTSIHDRNDRPDNRVIRFVQRSGNRCVEADLYGHVIFTPDDREIESVGPGGRVRFREVAGGTDRELSITSNGDRQSREYALNGRPADFDQEARSWLGSVILTVLRESAYNAPERVHRLERDGGTNRVLAEIDVIRSSSAKREYYSALLGLRRPLSDSTLTRVLSRVKREFASSSGDLRSILEKIPPRSVRTTQSRSAFADAIASIDSDGDKASLLIELAPTADAELLVDIMNVVKSIGSDGDKSNVLISAVARYLEPVDQELRDAFFSAAKTVGSDGDLSRVLITAARYGHQDSRVTEAAIETSLRLGSDGDKANVLTYIATQKLLTTTRIRDAYTSAALSIGSDGDRARVLRAALINQD